MYNQLTMEKKTVLTVTIMVKGKQVNALNKLGVATSEEANIESAEKFDMHISLRHVSHITPYFDDDTKCFVSLGQEHYFVDMNHGDLIAVINDCMVRHSLLNVPFAIFKAEDILAEINKRQKQ